MDKFISSLIYFVFGLLLYALGFGLFYLLASEFARQSNTSFSRETVLLFSAVAGAIWFFVGDIGLIIEERRKNNAGKKNA